MSVAENALLWSWKIFSVKCTKGNFQEHFHFADSKKKCTPIHNNHYMSVISVPPFQSSQIEISFMDAK